MKTKLLTGIAVVLIMFSNTALADRDHHNGEGSRQPMAGMMQSDEMPMRDMKKMHQQMGKMQKTMERIHSSENRKERQELMQQHMEEMHQGMGMMQGMMPGDTQKKMPGQMSEKQMPGKMGKRMKMMDEDDEMQDSKAMRKRHNMMEQRMDMMQGMMGQMMEHMMQQQKMGMGKK